MATSNKHHKWTNCTSTRDREVYVLFLVLLSRDFEQGPSFGKGRKFIGSLATKKKETNK